MSAAAVGPAAGPAVGVASDGSSGGWEAWADGQVTGFGGAGTHGDLSGVRLARPVVGIAATRDGGGYWLVASDGGVFSFGDARFFGSTGAMRLAEPVVGMAATPDGGGYWLVASDGGVFSFGDARFFGSTGAIRLARPVIAMAAGPGGGGYWLVASDGGVFAFGDAPFAGSGGGGAGTPTAGLAPLASGGYLLVSPTGSVTAFRTPSADPLAGAGFFVPPTAASSAEAAAASAGDAATASLLAKIADHENAVWLTDPSSNFATDVSSTFDAATVGGTVPVFVLYAIPDRDCGGFSSGGAADPASYHAFAQTVATAAAGRRAVYVVEPDALAGADCLDAPGRAARYGMIADAVSLLTAGPSRAEVYIDAGHAGWQDVPTMAARLGAAGVSRARGFSLNVSNFDPTGTEEAYGDALAAAAGGVHYVIDTSRNGAGPAPAGTWCNPPSMALGAPATAATGDPSADALLWVKTPGESDGPCNGGPAAGVWWTSYAVGLASRASW